MVKLAIEGTGGSEVIYEVAKSSVSIGASSDNDIVIRSPGVAPKHLVIQRNGDVFTFLGQKRQVAVLNGERRSRGVLKVGDRFRLGTANLIFKGSGDEETEIVFADDPEMTPAAGPKPHRTGAAGKKRAEVVLYSEPHRIAEARARMVEVFQGRVRSDLVPGLRGFLAQVFSKREAMVARLDEEGLLVPVVSQWSGDLPRLPDRTFRELAEGSRYAMLRIGGRLFLIYPVVQGPIGSRAFLVVETNEDFEDDDELILAELARLMAIHWDRVEASDLLFGPWESEAREALEMSLPGTSQAVRLLRDGVIYSARTQHPILMCGRPGVGRMTLAGLAASLNPSGALAVRVIQCREGGDEAFRTEFFGPGPELLNPAEVSEGCMLVLRDLHLLSEVVQREVAATIAADLETGWGPRVRWVGTTEEDPMILLNDGRLDPALYSLFRHHVIRVPSLQSRREDLPLLGIRLLDTVAAEQGKDIRGIELESLNSLLTHQFEGQMTEFLGELRRLVSATPSGDMIRGIVPAIPLLSGAGDGSLGDQSAAVLLGLDDLKVVVPAIERLVIDRVLARTKGNQSKAARVLNLSRGALISKMKDYEIPDYRYLRRG
jgi:DNA-binding NtrC family response regulator